MSTRRRRSGRSGRGALRSPGRPSAARREDRRQFWVLIAAGRSSEDAAVGVGVAPALVLCQPCSDALRADLLPRGLAVGGGGGEAVPGDADGGGA